MEKKNMTVQEESYKGAGTLLAVALLLTNYQDRQLSREKPYYSYSFLFLSFFLTNPFYSKYSYLIQVEILFYKSK